MWALIIKGDTLNPFEHVSGNSNHSSESKHAKGELPLAVQAGLGCAYLFSVNIGDSINTLKHFLFVWLSFCCVRLFLRQEQAKTSLTMKSAY